MGVCLIDATDVRPGEIVEASLNGTVPDSSAPPLPAQVTAIKSGQPVLREYDTEFKRVCTRFSNCRLDVTSDD